MCYEASVVWYCWQQHKLFLVSLPNHILVSCRPGPWQTPTGKNQAVLGLVIWQAMWCTVILLRSILQGTVRLRMCEQCWQVLWSPPDFFLWGIVKNQVYRTPVCDLADLQERINAAVNSVTPQMLHNTWVEVQYQLDISRATNGSHVEVYGT